MIWAGLRSDRSCGSESAKPRLTDGLRCPGAVPSDEARRTIRDCHHPLIVCRRGDRVRLFTRRGYDWTDRYPLIVATADALPCDATIDGEVLVCDRAGVADFERLHSREHDRQAFLWAFDLLDLDGEDL